MKATLIVAAVLLFICFLISTRNSSRSAIVPGTDDAINVCQKFVKDRLKAPGSAKFSDASETSSKAIGPGFNVTGWVDSQNVYGALLRSRYVCTVTLVGDQWHLEGLDLK